jgi:hypothetical protein
MNAVVESPKSLTESHAVIEAAYEEIAHLKQQYANLLEQIKLAKLR